MKASDSKDLSSNEETLHRECLDLQTSKLMPPYKGQRQCARCQGRSRVYRAHQGFTKEQISGIGDPSSFINVKNNRPLSTESAHRVCDTRESVCMSG